MLDISVLIATGAGVVSTGAASFFTWLFSKRKYNSEVDNNNIENMQKSLDFYIKLADDYKERLASEIESHNREVAELKAENAEVKKEMKDQERRFNDKLESCYKQLEAQQKEISLMKNQMLSMFGQVCLNFSCGERVLSKVPRTNYKTEQKSKLNKHNK